MLFASAVFFLFGAGSSLYNDPWTWGSRSVQDLDIISAVKTVRPDDEVAAFSPALPLLSERTMLIEFPRGLEIYKPAGQGYHGNTRLSMTKYCNRVALQTVFFFSRCLARRHGDRARSGISTV